MKDREAHKWLRGSSYMWLPRRFAVYLISLRLRDKALHFRVLFSRLAPIPEAERPRGRQILR